MKQYKHFCCKLHLVLMLILGIVGVSLQFALSLLLSPSSYASTYIASLSTSGTVNLNVSASGNGANVTSDSLSIISTCPSGYNVSIEGPTDSTLYKNGNSSNNSATQKILASSGTRNNPVSILGNNVKTWGYTTESINGSSPITTSSNFVGLTDTITNIFSSNSATSSTGTTLPVYYGASVDSTIEPGLYTMAESSQGANDNKITYYLTTSLSCTSYTVNFNPTSTAGGQTISGTGTMNPQTISEGTATTLTANAYTAPSGYYFAGWNTQQDGTGTHYANQQQVTDLTTVGNSITLYAEWTDCQPGKICYNDNGANSVTTMRDQTVGSSATSVVLWASNFQRSNYGFAGWNTKADGTGAQYGPNETIDDSTTLATIQSTGLKLYAKWIQSQGNLQDWQGCSSMSNGDVTALKDTRDNQVYAIAKLADGKCWMIENLRLNTSGSNDESKSQGFGGIFAGLANPETANFDDVTTANSLYYSGTQSGTATIDIGTTNAGYRFPRFNNQNSSSPVSSMNSKNSNIYSYGNYYTWSAAMANTDDLPTPTDSEVVDTSICPSGWRLPYGRDIGNGATAGSFSKLDIELGGTGTPSSSSTTPTGAEMSKLWRKYPNNFIYSGSLNGSSLFYRGSDGNYWSSTAENSGGGYSLYLDSSRVTPGNELNGKYYGRSVRCVVEDPPTLYDRVAKMNKGTQTAAELQTTITKPTSSNPSTDTSNSGVYEYNSSVFGTSSDASNDHKIYYYRGILDNDLDGTSSTYGSNGDGTLYPNYVKLGDTCWRIVRTTGSGGVKMIYNGLYSSGTNTNSCANATTDTQIVQNINFGLKGNSSQSTYWYRNVNRVGYTFNNTSSLQDSTTSTSVDTVFGSNSNYSTTNTTNSNIKNYIENTWFTSANGISAYESLLEPSAGYCNDRTIFSNTSGSTALSTIPPYATSNADAYFGSYIRNNKTNTKPTLTCPSSRNIVDLYTTSSASDGNKQLAKPVALLTIDEAALAGSGVHNSGGSAYSSAHSYSSYLRSGSNEFLLSPSRRESGGSGAIYSFYSISTFSYGLYNTHGVRPVVSLKPGVAPASGTGTAVDPWVINPASQTPTLNISADDITYGESANISISASSSATGNVVINIYQINGSDNPLIKTETKELVGGSTGLTVSGLGVGQYRVQVLYPGDIVYIPAEANKYFRVEDSLIPPIID